jgi:hypothetical protein
VLDIETNWRDNPRFNDVLERAPARAGNLLVYPVFRGFTRKMAIGCWQRRGNTLTCVHYIEDDKKTHPYHTAELKKLGFNFGRVFMSHDPNHCNPQTSQTDAQKMQDLGWTVQVLPKRLEPRSAPCQHRGCTCRSAPWKVGRTMHPGGVTGVAAQLCRMGHRDARLPPMPLWSAKFLPVRVGFRLQACINICDVGRSLF